MQTDSIIMNDTLSYGRIIFGGLAVTVAYNLCSGILRALGDSKTPFKAIIISSTVNIVLDILMIFLLKNGLPMAFMNSLTAVGCMIVQAYINKLGVD